MSIMWMELIMLIYMVMGIIDFCKWSVCHYYIGLSSNNCDYFIEMSELRSVKLERALGLEPARFTHSRVDKQKNEPGRLKVMYSYIFFGCFWLFNMSWRGNKLMHSGIIEILRYGGLKMTPWGYNGRSKFKSVWILFESMSDDSHWLKKSKNVIIFLKCDSWFCS